jgi:hypothetical protein
MAARFGSDQVSFSKKFLRIPILPHSVSLYATELKRLMLNGELPNTLRLSMLPCLATAAALEFKITGSDKGSGEADERSGEQGDSGEGGLSLPVSAPLQGLLD